jgi:phytoene/squalene synthetase
MPYHAASGRSYIPAEVSRRAALDPDDYARGRATGALRSAAAELADTAGRHLAEGRSIARGAPRSARPALLPATIADRALVRLKRSGYNPFLPELRAPDPLQSWRLAIAALTGRF